MEKLNIDCQKRCAGLLMPFDNVNTGDIIVQKRNLIDLYQKKGFRGEAFIIFKTDIVKRFLFPAIRNEKFLSESAYLRCIDQHYYYCCENDRIVTRKYYSDGLTKSINKIENKNRYSRAYAWKIDAAYGGKFLEKINAYGKYKKIRKKLGYEEFPEIEVNFVTRICSLLPFF